MNSGFSGFSRGLENEFFSRQDKVLAEKLKQMQKMQETKQALSEVSGITNDRVLQKLVELDIHPEMAAALAVVPLIEVAWADGSVDEKERTAALQAAERWGLKKGSIEYSLLERWLMQKPETKLLDAWVHYVEGLCENLGQEEKMALKNELMEHTQQIAKASGGILGLAKISKSEAQMIQKLENAFK